MFVQVSQEKFPQLIFLLLADIFFPGLENTKLPVRNYFTDKTCKQELKCNYNLVNHEKMSLVKIHLVGYFMEKLKL